MRLEFSMVVPIGTTLPEKIGVVHASSLKKVPMSPNASQVAHWKGAWSDGSREWDSKAGRAAQKEIAESLGHGTVRARSGCSRGRAARSPSFSIVTRFSMVAFYGRRGRLTARSGGFLAGQSGSVSGREAKDGRFWIG
jgi:hypothetical protein